MTYIAHIRENDSQVQTVEEHLLGVKELAETYGEKIGIKHLAGLAGMLHDMGKYTNEFKEYILEAVNNPNSPPKRGVLIIQLQGEIVISIIPYRKYDSLQRGNI